MDENSIVMDIDTQFDFMNPVGRLYVPGAETIIPIVSRVRRFAAEHGFSILATVDWHTRNDEEISDHPDFKNTFPPHCMAYTPGAVRIGDLGPIPVETLRLQTLSPPDLQSALSRKPFHLELRKNCVDIFTAPEINVLLDRIHPQTVIVFGVALDICVFNTVRGLLKRNREQVILLADAVKGIGKKPDTDILDGLRRMGARVTAFETLQKERVHVAPQR